jgi:hypothetical protein
MGAAVAPGPGGHAVFAPAVGPAVPEACDHPAQPLLRQAFRQPGAQLQAALAGQGRQGQQLVVVAAPLDHGVQLEGTVGRIKAGGAQGPGPRGGDQFLQAVVQQRFAALITRSRCVSVSSPGGSTPSGRQ